MFIFLIAMVMVVGWCVIRVPVVHCNNDQVANCSHGSSRAIEECDYREETNSCVVRSCFSSNNGSGMNCPPGLFCDNGTCKCGHYPYNVIKCDEREKSSAVLHCYCATFDENKKLTLVGKCIYNCEYHGNDNDIIYHSLPNSSVPNDPLYMLIIQ